MSRRTGSALAALLAVAAIVPSSSRAAPPPRAPTPLPPAPPGAAWHGWERDLRLEVQIDRGSAWLGEQVTASVTLLSPVGVLGIDGLKPPAYDGFWAEPLEAPRRLVPQRRVVNGIPLVAFLVQRIALFPTRAGRLTIEPFQVDVTLQLVTGNRLLDPMRSVERARRTSAPVVLDVHPLPAGAPAGFESVNVGALSLELAPSETTLPAGEPLALRLTARGTGNVRAWSLPPLPPIPGTRRFDPTSSEQVGAERSRIGGSRTVETLVVPERAGELVVPPLSLPWFDPKTGRYQVARTAELRVPVGPRTGGASASPAGAQAGVELRPIRPGDPLEPDGRPPWRSPLFALSALLPPAAFAAGAMGQRLRDRARLHAPARRARDAERSAGRRLAGARRRMGAGDVAGFVAEVERALTGYAEDRLGHPVAGLTRARLGATLAAAGAHDPAVRALLGTLDACDAARFGRASAGEPLLRAAVEAVAHLEEAEWTAGAGGSP